MVTTSFYNQFIFITDKLIWHCQLSNPVLPEKCKIKPAGKRIELKLKKAYCEQWTDLECIDTPQHTALEEEKELPNVIVNKSENEQMDVAPICNDKETEVHLLINLNYIFII